MLRRRLTEAAATFAAAALGTTLFYCNVYGSRTYGWALFIAVPFAVGFVAGAMLSRRPSVFPAIFFAFAAAVLIAAVLLLMGREGLICILLALPLSFVPLLLGAAAGYTVFRRRFVPPPAGALLVLAIGGMAYAEPHVLGGAPVVAVADSIVIDAPASRVWSAIVGLDAVPSNDWVYRAGLACPQRARITRPGRGGERVCTLSTGTLVERIEVWEPDRRLRWRSVTTPPPMRELNPFHDRSTRRICAATTPFRAASSCSSRSTRGARA